MFAICGMIENPFRFTYWQGELPIVAITTYEKIVDTVQRDADTYTGRLAMEEFTKLFKGRALVGLTTNLRIL